jgi:hypothetical protein
MLMPLTIAAPSSCSIDNGGDRAFPVHANQLRLRRGGVAPQPHGTGRPVACINVYKKEGILTEMRKDGYVKP